MLIFGNHRIHYDRIGSTNDAAIEYLAKTKPPEGTLISAAEQYAGKGQFGSKWEAAPGQNCTFSVILYPDFLPSRQLFALNMVFSLGLLDCLEKKYDIRGLSVKWPNDLYAHDLKLSGMLLQTSLRGNRLEHVVAGIGLNVNQTDFGALQSKAASLALLKGHNFIPEAVTDDLLNALEYQYLRLRRICQSGASPIHTLSTEYCDRLYLHKVPATFYNEAGEPFDAAIQGIDEEGRLLLRHKDDLTTTHQPKSISYPSNTHTT